MSVKDPEFKKALDAASENAYQAVSRDTAKILREVDRKRAKIGKQVEKIKRDADAIRRNARSQMLGTRAMAMGRGFPVPNMRDMSIDDIRNYAEKLRSEPHLRSIEQNFLRVQNQTVIKLLECPECGDGDHGNTKNKIPWCLKCDAPLLKPGKQIENWRKHSIKRVG